MGPILHPRLPRWEENDNYKEHPSATVYYLKLNFILSRCNWVAEQWAEESNLGRYTQIESLLSVSNQHDNNIKKNFRKTMELFADLRQQYNTEVISIGRVFSQYISGIITKEGLSNFTASRKTEATLMNLAMTNEKLRETLTIIDEDIDSFRVSIMDTFDSLLDRVVPLMKPVQIGESKFLKLVFQINENFIDVITKNTLSLDSNGYRGKVSGALKILFQDYTSLFMELRNTICTPIQDLISSIDILSTDLKAYIQSLHMDEAFIM